MKLYKPYFKENIDIDLNPGDSFKFGKFKNKTAIYKSHYINNKGDLIIITDTDKEIPAMRVRLVKQENKKNKNYKGSDGSFEKGIKNKLQTEKKNLEKRLEKDLDNITIKKQIQDLEDKIENINKILKKIEETKQWIFIKLDENLRFSDLKKHAGLSDFTKPFMKQRQKIKGAGNKSAKLVQMKVNKKQDYVSFIFLSEPTYTFDAKAVKLKSPDKSFKKINLYTQELRILDFFKLLQTNPEYDKNKVTINNIKEVLKVADVKVSCDDPSFWWQGDAWVLTQFDASIVPSTIEPTHWKKYHHDHNYVCKHLSMILSQIDFFIPIMAGMINKYITK